MRNHAQRGKYIPVIATVPMISGAGYLFGNLFGIAIGSCAVGDEVDLQLEGIFNLPKVSAQSWTVGAKIYWDDVGKVTTTVTAGNILIGVAVLPAANPSSTGRVRLNGTF
jgi:predicted RecA/RadA family phage recombinase